MAKKQVDKNDPYDTGDPLHLSIVGETDEVVLSIYSPIRWYSTVETPDNWRGFLLKMGMWHSILHLPETTQNLRQAWEDGHLGASDDPKWSVGAHNRFYFTKAIRPLWERQYAIDPPIRHHEIVQSWRILMRLARFIMY